jgi:hypothetical protein
MKTLCFFLIVMTSACPDKKDNKASEAQTKKGIIEMSRSVCFGKCPAYKISINEKGEVRYEGEKNVDKIGKYTKKLSASATDSLFKEFINANFWSFQDEYTSHATDLPTTFISFTLNEKSKKIKDYTDAPEKLRHLEKLVEQVAFSAEGWTKVGDDN